MSSVGEATALTERTSSPVKEFMCMAHGRFDSRVAVCPHGCSTVERIFVTPVGIRSARTANIDSTFQQIAGNYNLSDMNNRGGKAARVLDGKTQKAMIDAQDYNTMLQKRFGAKSLVGTRDGVGAWGGVNPGGVYRVGGTIVEQQRGGGAPTSTAAIGAPAENVVESVKPALQKPTIIAKRDPDRASRTKVMSK